MMLHRRCLLGIVGLVDAVTAWQAVYNANFTTAYVQSSNGSTWSIGIPASQITTDQVHLQLTTISSPPSNSSLVLDNDGHLLAVWGSEGCGKSPIQVSSYSVSENKWKTLAQSSQNWYQSASVVWHDRTNDTVYVYGGDCNGDIQGSFYGYNLATNEFFAASASPMPREMAYAQAISLDGSSTIMIGGRANSGWLSMQQVAFWEYGSWTYRTINGVSGIDSRDSPLVLPLWNSAGKSGELPTVSNLVVAGGTVNGRAASPDVIVLEFNSSAGWSWAKTDLPLSDVAFSLYHTLAEISTGSTELYDGDNSWQQVKSVAVPASTAAAAATAGNNSSNGKKFNTASIATLSTILPLIVIIGAVVAVFMWWRKRQQRLTFMPRQAKLESPSMSEAFGPDWSTPSYRDPFADTASNVDSNIGDVQILVSKQRQPLRVMNPDDTFESEEAMKRGYSQRSMPALDPTLSPVLEAGSSTEALASRQVSQRSSASRRVASGNPFLDDFDFTNSRSSSTSSGAFSFSEEPKELSRS